MAFRDKTNPNAQTNEFDLARDTFKLLTSKMQDYEKLVDLYTQSTTVAYETHNKIAGLLPSINQLKSELVSQMEGLRSQMEGLRYQIDSLRTQQGQMQVEAILIRRDLEVLLDMLGDSMAYSKEDKESNK